MKKTLYVLLALILIIGSILWAIGALMLYGDSFLQPEYLVFNFIACSFGVLIGGWIFKAIYDGRIK